MNLNNKLIIEWFTNIPLNARDMLLILISDFVLREVTLKDFASEPLILKLIEELKYEKFALVLQDKWEPERVKNIQHNYVDLIIKLSEVEA